MYKVNNKLFVVKTILYAPNDINSDRLIWLIGIDGASSRSVSATPTIFILLFV